MRFPDPGGPPSPGGYQPGHHSFLSSVCGRVRRYVRAHSLRVRYPASRAQLPSTAVRPLIQLPRGVEAETCSCLVAFRGGKAARRRLGHRSPCRAGKHPGDPRSRVGVAAVFDNNRAMPRSGLSSCRARRIKWVRSSCRSRRHGMPLRRAGPTSAAGSLRETTGGRGPGRRGIRIGGTHRPGPR